MFDLLPICSLNEAADKWLHLYVAGTVICGLNMLVSNNVFQRVCFSFSVYMRCTGGEVGATSALAPKIGPLGLVSLSE